MAVILSNRVDVSGGWSQLIGNSGLIELHDSGRFILGRLAPGGSHVSEMYFDLPVTELQVKGADGVLTISANGVKKRVDFAPNSRALVGFGLVGALVAANAAKTSGVTTWIDAFRHYGVPTRYAPTFNGKRMLIIIGVITGIFVVTCIGAVLVNLH
jgi:hypothetical protein